MSKLSGKYLKPTEISDEKGYINEKSYFLKIFKDRTLVKLHKIQQVD